MERMIYANTKKCTSYRDTKICICPFCVCVCGKWEKRIFVDILTKFAQYRAQSNQLRRCLSPNDMDHVLS